MPMFVALLRGVNVGKGNRVPMAELRTLVEQLGGSGVTTLLNSGNVVFSHAGRSPAKHAAAIAAGLQQRLALSVPVVVKSSAEFAAVLRDNPMPPGDGEHSRFLVAFAQEPSSLQALAPLAALAQPPERFVVGDAAAYLACPDGLLQSRVGEALLGKAGRGVTTRNWATVLKLAAALGIDAPQRGAAER